MRAGRPEDSGISLQIVQQLGPQIPVFGVCMGHQCIGQIFGGNITRAPGGVMHGKTSLVYHNNTSLMKVCQATLLLSAQISGFLRVSRVHHDAYNIAGGLKVSFVMTWPKLSNPSVQGALDVISAMLSECCETSK